MHFFHTLKHYQHMEMYWPEIWPMHLKIGRFSQRANFPEDRAQNSHHLHGLGRNSRSILLGELDRAGHLLAV